MPDTDAELVALLRRLVVRTENDQATIGAAADRIEKMAALIADPAAILNLIGGIDGAYEALGLTVRRMVMPSPGGVTGGAYGIVDFINEHPQERVDFVVRPRREATDA